jgi:hypothetical protein
MIQFPTTDANRAALFGLMSAIAPLLNVFGIVQMSVEQLATLDVFIDSLLVFIFLVIRPAPGTAVVQIGANGIKKVKNGDGSQSAPASQQ